MTTNSKRHRHDSLDDIAVFVQVAQSESFTAAARQLSLSASGVSRAIGRLENRIGVHLVNRTTRRLSLTAEGSAYFQRCRQILADLEDAETEISEAGSIPRGPLRIQLPRGFGNAVIIPLLTDFAALYPEVTLHISVYDGAINPAEEGVDASFVLGEPLSGDFVARKLCSIGYAVCAAPDYLENHGEPAIPDDLANHRCLNYVHPRSGRAREWVLTDAGREISIPVASVLRANDIRTIHQAAVSGAGLAYLMDFLIAEDISSGRLKIVMPRYVRRDVPVYVCYPQNRHRLPRVTAFVEYLRAALSADPIWSIDRLIELIDD